MRLCSYNVNCSAIATTPTPPCKVDRWAPTAPTFDLEPNSGNQDSNPQSPSPSEPEGPQEEFICSTSGESDPSVTLEGPAIGASAYVPDQEVLGAAVTHQASPHPSPSATLDMLVSAPFVCEGALLSSYIVTKLLHSEDFVILVG